MTTVNLSKGGNINLSKVAALTEAIVPLGWKVRTTSGEDFDLDVSVFMVTESGKVRGPEDFIFYENTTSADGSVIHRGDNLVGNNEGDAETIEINFTKVPEEIHKMVVAVTIHKAAERKQNFGQVSGAFIRIVDSKNQKEIARFDLTEDFEDKISMIFGEFYRKNTDWKFRAVGQGYNGGLIDLCADHGIKASYD